MMGRLRTIGAAALLLLAVPGHAQDKRVEEQRRAIEALEKKIADQEREISKLQKGRAASEERARRLTRQIADRSQLLEATEREADGLRDELTRADSVAGGLAARLERSRAHYAAMAREAYRNYRHNNFLTYLFASRDFADAARRITALRETAALRARKLAEIAELNDRVQAEREKLARRSRSLDSVMRRATAQREKLRRDADAAKADIRQLSQKEHTALQRKTQQEQQLDEAIAALRKLTKGNKEGASFSSRTSGLRLPVVGGRVKRYKENMAEVVGQKGARVIAIYEGKVVEVKRNRITGKYDVFVAHGEYITSYANLATIAVEKGQKIAKNGVLGTIGVSVDNTTMKTEYKLVFGIYAPDPKRQMKAESCFRK